MNVTVEGAPEGITVHYKPAVLIRIERECELRGFEIAIKAKLLRQTNLADRSEVDRASVARVRADGNDWFEERAALVRRIIGPLRRIV